MKTTTLAKYWQNALNFDPAEARDSKGKWVSDGGFVRKKPNFEKRKKKGWQKLTPKQQAAWDKKTAKKLADRQKQMEKDIALTKPVPKKGVKFFDPSMVPHKTSKGMVAKTAPKPGEAFDFKAKAHPKDPSRVPVIKFKGKNKGVAMGPIMKDVKEYRPDKLKAALGHVKKFGGTLPEFKDKSSLKFKDRTPQPKHVSRMSPAFNKVDILIKHGDFKESDRSWLKSLKTNQLNILFITHFKVDPTETPARSPHGKFVKDGSTAHQVRKLNKMGIKARMCAT